MKLKKEDLFQKAKTILGERDDDEALGFLEDLNDTISGDNKDDDWEKKYNNLLKDKDELDKAWRQRYRERFFSSDSHTDEDINPANNAHKDEEPDLEEQAKKVRFDDLFSEE